MSDKYFDVTLLKGMAGRPESQRKTLLGLGLSRIGKKVSVKDTPAIRGMLYKVVHMVDVEAKTGSKPLSTRQKRNSASA